VLMFNLLHITYREGLVLLAVMLPDILLRYGASSARLRDTVACLCCRLCDSIVPWDDVRACLLVT